MDIKSPMCVIPVSVYILHCVSPKQYITENNVKNKNIYFERKSFSEKYTYIVEFLI